MPVYEYECAEHGHYEVVRSVAERADAPCPACGRVGRRLMSPFYKGIIWQFDAHYNRGLKTYIRDRSDWDREMKKRGGVLYDEVYGPDEEMPDDYVEAMGINDFKREIVREFTEGMERAPRELKVPVYVDDEKVV